MRMALLTVAIAAAILLALSGAHAAFDCFETSQHQLRCACTGGRDCIELQNSGRCKSGFKCDDGELGAMICSCKAVRKTSRTR